jgi:hypothetical protein
MRTFLITIIASAWALLGLMVWALLDTAQREDHHRAGE